MFVELFQDLLVLLPSPMNSSRWSSLFTDATKYIGWSRNLTIVCYSQGCSNPFWVKNNHKGGKHVLLHHFAILYVFIYLVYFPFLYLGLLRATCWAIAFWGEGVLCCNPRAMLILSGICWTIVAKIRFQNFVSLSLRWFELDVLEFVFLPQTFWCLLYLYADATYPDLHGHTTRLYFMSFPFIILYVFMIFILSNFIGFRSPHTTIGRGDVALRLPCMPCWMNSLESRVLWWQLVQWPQTAPDLVRLSADPNDDDDDEDEDEEDDDDADARVGRHDFQLRVICGWLFYVWLLVSFQYWPRVVFHLFSSLAGCPCTPRCLRRPIDTTCSNWSWFLSSNCIAEVLLGPRHHQKKKVPQWHPEMTWWSLLCLQSCLERERIKQRPKGTADHMFSFDAPT